MAFTNACLFSLLGLALVVSAEAEIDRHVVPCGPLQGVCECRETADECEFTLLVEELQTFVSYKLEAVNTDSAPVINKDYKREDAGRPFYINSTGSLIPSSEGSECTTYNENFKDAQCTVPITVDGLTYRPCIAVNSQVPGPTLIAYENQTIIANVINGLISHWR